MTLSLFDFTNYRNYLKKILSRDHSPRGVRARLAEFLNCQTSFLSQVLTDRAHLSLEHAIKVSQFLKHSELEKKYFMLLVQKEKAGSTDLASYFDEEITQILEDRQIIQEEIQVQSQLPLEDQARYYSSWWYSAIHISVALPTINRPKDIEVFLGLAPERVQNSLDFLISRGLITQKDGRLQIGQQRIHLGSKSPLISSHHRNWRLKAVDSIEQNLKSNLHFTGVLGLSKQTAEKIKKLTLDLIRDAEPLIRETKDEEMHIFSIDFFKIHGEEAKSFLGGENS